MAAVVDRLRQVVTDVAAELYPERPELYTLRHPKGALLVDFRAGRYDDPRTMGLMAQERRLEIGVTAVARGLHDSTGAVPLLDAARLALLGWRPADGEALADPFSMVAERYVGQSAGLWFYELVVATRHMVLEARDSGDGQGITRIKVDYGFEEVTL
jgi:hypothetical protein